MSVRRVPGSARCFGCIVSLFLSFSTTRSEAAPTTEGLVIAETPRCRVSFSELSYDDPGADDAEFLVLRVERKSEPAGAGGAPACAPDPTTQVDGGPSGALTLGDCGLSVLELVNGGTTACDVYRAIPLGGVAVPPDDVVTLCATDAVLGGACDVMSAGASALRNGWLQNGPADGLRFVTTTAGRTELAYEGRPACFTASALALNEEVGQLATAPDGTDDVNVVCDGAAVLVGRGTPALRDAVTCKGTSPLANVVDASARPLPRLEDSGPTETAWTPERAGAPSSSTSPFGSLHLDASVVPLKHAAADPPRPPSCGVGRENGSDRALVCAVVAALCVVRGRRRTGR